VSGDDRLTTPLVEPDPERGTVVLIDLRRFTVLFQNETNESIEIHILPKDN
jgi:hypothetical protein